MPNIPFIQHNRNAPTPQTRRTKHVFESDDSTNNPNIKRRLDRRNHGERRKKNTHVIVERRQRGIRRKKNISADTNTTNISATIGKHINTTA